MTITENCAVGREFVLACFLKCQNDKFDSIIFRVQHELNNWIKDNGTVLVSRFAGPYIVLGRFDILFLMYGSDIEILTSLFYKTIYRLNTDKDAGRVIDFSKIILYEWDHLPANPALFSFAPSDIPTTLPIAGFILVKLTGLSPEPPLRTPQLVNDLTADLAAIVGLNASVFGGLSYHHLGLLVKSPDHHNILKLLSCLRKNNIVLKTTTFFLVESASWINGDYSIYNAPINDNDVTLLSLLNLKPSMNGHDLPSLPRSLFNDKEADNDKHFYKIGHSDVARMINGKSVVDGFSKIKQLEQSDCLERRTTLLLFNNLDNANTTNVGTINQSTNNSDADIAHMLRMHPEPTVSISSDIDTSIDAIVVQLGCLSEEDSYAVKIRSGIIYGLAKIREAWKDSRIGPSAALDYISTIRNMMKDRLSGSFIGSQASNRSSMHESFGGSHILTTACEGLLTRALNAYLDISLSGIVNNCPTSYELPIVLVSFADSPPTPSEYPFEFAAVGLEENIPMLVRLPQLKYAPWLWILGLRQMAYWLHVGLGMDYNNYDYLEIDEFTDSLCLHFLSKERYVEAICEENRLFKPEYDANRTITKLYANRAKIKYVMKNKLYIYERFKDREQIWKTNDIKHKEEYYRQRLRTGFIAWDLMTQPINLAAYVNAYSSLWLDERTRPQAFCSFVNSLYRIHPRI